MTIIRNDERLGELDLSIKITVKLYISKKRNHEALKTNQRCFDYFFSIYNFFRHVLVFSEDGWWQGGYPPPPSTHTCLWNIQIWNKILIRGGGRGRILYLFIVHFLIFNFHDFGKVTFLNFSCQDFLNEWLSSSKTNATCLFVL